MFFKTVNHFSSLTILFSNRQIMPRPTQDLVRTWQNCAEAWSGLTRDLVGTCLGLARDPTKPTQDLATTRICPAKDPVETYTWPCWDLIGTLQGLNVGKYFLIFCMYEKSSGVLDVQKCFYNKTFFGIWCARKIILNTKLQKCYC